ncbi:MAG: rod shape-determining protein RodA [Dysgonamonadaceae bacterium]|jgi:rod shape determining protein RodA|nr:rod shape-determining protein RodA [Dysgonamonadaceae bacterium]
MPYRKSNIWTKLDWWTVAVYLILIFAGWFSIYAASYDFDKISIFDVSGRAGMQMIWIGTSLILGLLLLQIDSSWYEFFSYWIYILVILALIATIFLAPDIKGSRSWLVIGPVRLQPAEFAKFATALAIARFMGAYKYELRFDRKFFLLVAIILLPLLLIIMQKETGSALVFLAFFIVLYREGMSGKLLFSAFCAILFFIIGIKYGEETWGLTPKGEFAVLVLIIIFANLWMYGYRKKGRRFIRTMNFCSAGLGLTALVTLYFVPFNLCIAAYGILAFMAVYMLFIAIRYWAWHYILPVIFIIFSVVYLMSADYVFYDIMKPYQQMRIKVSLGMIEDPKDVGYNVNQSKIAIGSGGLYGKGFMHGTQTKLKFVPEQDTDFIFCTVGEEEGFVGATAVMLLFLFLLVRLIIMAERQHSAFCRIYGYGVASVIFFHLAINVGMVTGISPVIGIPLPFFSYGGSSLWSFTILLFIFLRLDASRNDSMY